MLFLWMALGWCAIATPASGQYKSLGIGGMFGSPTALSVKQWITRTSAFDLGAGWSLSRNPGIHLHGDLLFHRDDVEGLERGTSYVYVGIGTRIKAAFDDPRAGIRFPLGFTFINQEEPMDAFIELVPIMDVLPRPKFAMNVSVGGRFYIAGNRRRY